MNNFKEGIEYYKNKEYPNAMISFLSSNNNPFCIFMLGYMHDKGIYVMKNEYKANKYYSDIGVNTPMCSQIGDILDKDRNTFYDLLISNNKFIDIEHIHKLGNYTCSDEIKVFVYEFCYEKTLDSSFIPKLIYHLVLIKDIKKANDYLRKTYGDLKDPELICELLSKSKSHLKSCQYTKWLEILLNSCLFQHKEYHSLITEIKVEFLEKHNTKCSMRLFYKFALMGFEDGMKKLENQYVMTKPESLYYKAKIYQMGYRIRRVDNRQSIFYLQSAWKNSKNSKIKKELYAIKIKLKLLEQITKTNKFCDIIIK